MPELRGAGGKVCAVPSLHLPARAQSVPNPLSYGFYDGSLRQALMTSSLASGDELPPQPLCSLEREGGGGTESSRSSSPLIMQLAPLPTSSPSSRSLS